MQEKNARKEKRVLVLSIFHHFCREIKIIYEKIQPGSVAFCFDIGRHYIDRDRVQDLWGDLVIAAK
ncbi:hypothetical protein QUF90_03880 [Desulfococcaceae bacterium HSG9]|nr:hypothetical protein [Desulfococcaceae bacterium HSG9]